MPASCKVCSHDQRELIDRAILAGTSLRTVASTFGVGRTAVQRHGANHVHAADVRAEAAKARKQAMVELASAPLPEVKRIESPADVVEDLQRLRVEAFGLFEAAKARSDWKSAERIFQQVVAVVDRFGEMHRVLGSKGVTISVDRSTQVLNVLSAMSEGELRAALLAAEGMPIADVIDA